MAKFFHGLKQGLCAALVLTVLITDAAPGWTHDPLTGLFSVPSTSAASPDLFTSQALSLVSVPTLHNRLEYTRIFAVRLMTRFIPDWVWHRPPPRVASHVDTTPAIAEIKHVIVAALGSAGDLIPYLAVGVELSRRYRVTVMASGHFESMVKDAGLEFALLGTDAEYEAIRKNPLLFDTERRKEGLKMLLTALAGGIERAYDWIVANTVPGETVILSNPYVMGAKIAAEKLGIPFVVAVVAPSQILSVIAPARLGDPDLLASAAPWKRRLIYAAMELVFADPLLKPEFNRVRKKAGLPRSANRILFHWMMAAEQLIYLFASEFAAPQRDWPQGKLTGFSFHNAGEALSSPLEEFLDRKDPRPVVTFTQGTPIFYVRDVFDKFVKACELAGVRGVFIGPMEQMPEHLPDSIFAAPWAPFDELFARSQAVVIHGGVNSSATALRQGVPVLVIPWAFDQYDNSKRLGDLGVGMEVSKEADPAVIAAALRRLIEDQKIRERSRDVAEQIRRELPGKIAGANEIEAMIRRLPRGPLDRKLPYLGRVVFITGASSGLGEALARDYARRGAAVVLTARRKDRLDAIAAQFMREGFPALAIACDVTQREELDHAIEVAIAHFGQIDELVANAGISVSGPTALLPPDQVRRLLDVNINGVFNTVQAGLSEIRRRKGRIVLTGSILSLVGMPDESPYVMSKHAVGGLAESLHMELADEGIEVTLLLPGYVRTELLIPDWVPESDILAVDRAARILGEGIQKGQRYVFTDFNGRYADFMSRHFPWSAPWLMKNWIRRQKAKWERKQKNNRRPPTSPSADGRISLPPARMHAGSMHSSSYHRLLEAA